MRNRIRELRKDRGYTMKQLGEMLDLAESTISQYETGKRQPDNETLLKLGEIFEVTVGYLLGAETQKAPANVETEDAKITDETLKFALWGDASNIDDADLEDVRRYAAFIAERKNNKK